MTERITPYPEVRVRNGWLLTETVSPHFPAFSPNNKHAVPLPTHEQVEETVVRYQNAWEPRQHRLLSGMCRIFNLAFRKNIIDANIAPGFNALSQPLIMGTDYQSDHFVDVLSHELIHILLVDNTTYEDSGNSLVAHWRKLFGVGHPEQTLIHIPVHAGLEALYTEVLEEPYRLQRDVANCAGRYGYQQAWDYVQKVGYETVIDQVVSTHQLLAEDQG